MKTDAGKQRAMKIRRLRRYGWKWRDIGLLFGISGAHACTIFFASNRSLVGPYYFQPKRKPIGCPECEYELKTGVGAPVQHHCDT